MDARWNSLTRGTKYVFVLGHGIPAFAAVFHEILPDGTLKVADAGPGSGRVSHLNPDQLCEARETN